MTKNKLCELHGIKVMTNKKENNIELSNNEEEEFKEYLLRIKNMMSRSENITIDI